VVAAPISIKNRSGERETEMHQLKKGTQGHFGSNAEIVVDADPGLVRTVVVGTAADVDCVTQANALVHCEESDAFADEDSRLVFKGEETQGIRANWHVAMGLDKRQVLDQAMPTGHVLGELEAVKASIRAKVEHPFRVIKREFGFAKMCCRALMKNTAQLHMLFVLSNLRMARHSLSHGPLA
jgi:transposase, IS5 family